MKMIKGYYARYWVSQSGNVYDILKLKRVDSEMNTSGYMHVRLLEYPFKEPVIEYNDKGWSYCKQDKLVHRLVAEAYIPCKSPWWTHVNHMDCNTLNNSVSNLEWVSNRENLRHAYIMGRYNGGRFGQKISQFSVYSVVTDKGTYNKFAGIKKGKIATGYMTKGKFYPNYK